VHKTAPRDSGVTAVRENERLVPRYQKKMLCRFRYPIHRFDSRLSLADAAF
jgi:hypothetical protein